MKSMLLSIETLIEALDLTWKGMLTIFLGIAVIFLVIFLLSKIKKKDI